MVATSLEIASNCSLAATSSEEAKKVAVEGMNVVVNTVDEIKNHAVKTREDANRVIEQMAERGIACNVHYKPLPMMTAYKALGFDIKDYPNAFHLFENEVTLPLHTRLTDEDVEYVISNFVEILNG